MASEDYNVEAAGRCAVELADPIERLFALVTGVGAAMATVCETAFAAGDPLTSRDLDVLSSPILSALASDRLPVGIGVVVDPGLLIDETHYLEWLQRDTSGTPVPLLLDLDPASDDRYDYPEMEWFRVPKEERRRMVGGPYFDYRGTDRYALTLAVPVLADGRFVGVAGADIPLSHIEAEVLPALRRLGARAALINHERRVVTANTPHFVTGARLQPEELASAIQVIDVVADLGWKLVVSASST